MRTSLSIGSINLDIATKWLLSCKHNNMNPTVTRRQFLGRSATALGSVLAAPAIVPASALGLNGTFAPSERITMGFIGVGTQGGGHLLGGAWTYVAGGYAGRKEVQVLAVCDIWRDRRERATKRVNDHYAEVYGQGSYKSCEAYNDFREVLARPDIDAVLIATPAHWHATMAAMAAAAGKDIYCEKPTAVTIQESQAMLAAVRRYGRVYQAGTQQRSEYGGKFRQACEFVRSGRIGKLKAIYAYRDGGAIFWPPRFGAGKPVPEGFDYDSFLGPAPTIPGPWKSSCGVIVPDTSTPMGWSFMENLIPVSRWAARGALALSAQKAASPWTAAPWFQTRRTSSANRSGRAKCIFTSATATPAISCIACAPASRRFATPVWPI